MGDMVYLLLPIPALRSRRHLYYVFRLCCLCLSESSPELPPIRFQGANISDPRCRLATLLLPAQSYVANGVGSAATCTTDEAMEKYRSLRTCFGSGYVARNPWVRVDSFGRSEIFKKLSASLSLSLPMINRLLVLLRLLFPPLNNALLSQHTREIKEACQLSRYSP